MTWQYGTLCGAIGTIITLSPEQFEFFKEVEVRLNTVINGVGGLSHSKWRSFRNERRRASPDGALNFVDGDLVERFLDLPEAKQLEVVDGFQVHCQPSHTWTSFRYYPPASLLLLACPIAAWLLVACSTQNTPLTIP